MCGIAGIFKFNNSSAPVDIGAVRSMLDAQVHRGPDDSGIFQDSNILLGHLRLSIIDLSSAGRQPMSNEDETILITFNGEIYNYAEIGGILREKGHRFKSNSDTEVIVHGYEEWGIEGLLERLRGMFAFAIYDSRTAIRSPKLIIARDRLGIKPLYYLLDKGLFVFASEIKSILASKLSAEEIDSQGVFLFLNYGSIPPPKTVYKGIFSLEPGHFIVVDENGIEKKRYYDLKNAFLDRSLAGISESEAIDRIRFCLTDVIKCHLVSDVPVGAFLSGGVDSTSIVALMREAEHQQIRTVSVIFPGTSYDESKYSKLASQRFNTEHVEIEVCGRDLSDHLDKILSIMDQPTVDGVNSYFISLAAARSGLKVIMSGLGADEIFWGYPSFSRVPGLYSFINVLSAVPSFRRIARFILENSGKSTQKTKLYSMFSGDLSLPDIYLNYRGLFTIEQIQELLHPDFKNEIIKEFKPVSYIPDSSFIKNRCNQVSFLETTSYMANQLLRDTDLFSMAHSLEVRVPYIDHLLVELLAKIPVSYKVSRNTVKRLLKKALYNKLPEEIVNSAKKGFTLPFDLWLKNELKGYMEDTLLSKNNSLLNSQFIGKLWKDFLDGKAHWARPWACAVLSKWVNEL